MRGTEAFKLKNQAAGTYAVQPDGAGAPYLFGGRYQWSFDGTGSGTVDLKQLQADGSTYVPVITQISATGKNGTVDLPPGVYQVVIASFTANYFTLTRVPVSE